MLATDKQIEMMELVPMTTDMYRDYFAEYENDPDLYLDKSQYSHYEFSEEKVGRYIKKQKDLNRIPLAIICDGEIVGEILIKNIVEGEAATMSIALKNDKYKDKGIGTKAEMLAVQYVFNELNIPILYADSVVTNTRSQHVLEKVGFILIKEDKEFKYYRISKRI